MKILLREVEQEYWNSDNGVENLWYFNAILQNRDWCQFETEGEMKSKHWKDRILFPAWCSHNHNELQSKRCWWKYAEKLDNKARLRNAATPWKSIMPRSIPFVKIKKPNVSKLFWKQREAYRFYNSETLWTVNYSHEGTINWKPVHHRSTFEYKWLL